MARYTKIILALIAIGVADNLVTQYNADAIAAPDVGIRRLGFHQGKTEAYWLYFFISHVYDAVLNPWHWTPPMRDAALAANDFGLRAGQRACDVGCPVAQRVRGLPRARRRLTGAGRGTQRGGRCCAHRALGRGGLCAARRLPRARRSRGACARPAPAPGREPT